MAEEDDLLDHVLGALRLASTALPADDAALVPLVPQHVVVRAVGYSVNVRWCIGLLQNLAVPLLCRRQGVGSGIWECVCVCVCVCAYATEMVVCLPLSVSHAPPLSLCSSDGGSDGRKRVEFVRFVLQTLTRDAAPLLADLRRAYADVIDTETDQVCVLSCMCPLSRRSLCV